TECHLTRGWGQMGGSPATAGFVVPRTPFEYHVGGVRARGDAQPRRVSVTRAHAKLSRDRIESAKRRGFTWHNLHKRPVDQFQAGCGRFSGPGRAKPRPVAA